MREKEALSGVVCSKRGFAAMFVGEEEQNSKHATRSLDKTTGSKKWEKRKKKQEAKLAAAADKGASVK